MGSSNEVSIIIRVNDSEAEKLRKTGEAAKAAAGQIIGASARATAAQDADAARQRANAEALQAFKIRTLGENYEAEIAAQKKLDRMHAAALAEQITREKATNEAIQRLHAAAIAEDIARERTRTVAIAREREKAALVSRAAVGGALSGIGAGAILSPAGLALAAAGTTIFSSGQAQQVERTEQALAAVVGTLEQAHGQMGFVREQADRLGTSLFTMAGSWTQFLAAAKGTNLEGEKSREVFLALNEAGARLHLTNEAIDGSLRAVAQMMSKGTVQAEELRGQLGDRLPGAFNIMARALGVSTAKLGDMLKAGEVLSDEALPKFAAELRKTFDTDANTRIDSTTANFERFKNEIKLTAAAVGDELNPALSGAAGWMAQLLKDTREYGFGGLAGSGVLDRQFEAEKAERLRGLDNVFSTNYVTGAGTFDFAPAALGPALTGVMAGPKPTPTGLDLLTQGGGLKDPKETARLQEQIALLGKKTELEKTEWEIERGRLKDSDVYTQNLARELAMKKDALNASKAVVKEAAAGQREADQFAEADLKRALRKEEIERNATRDQMVRNEIDRQQLDLGRNLTQSERELVELKTEGANLSGTSLENEIRIGIALEEQIRQRRQIKTDADKAAQAIESYGSGRQTRRDIRDARSFSEIDSTAGGAIDKAGREHLDRIADLERQREEQIDVNRDYDALELASYQQYEDEKTRITRDAQDARKNLMEQYTASATTALSDLQVVTDAMGKKGFKVGKELAIAETVINTYSSAQKAFDSLADIPYVGPALGAAAAAAAVAAGMARVAQIRSMEYGGGRRFGGPVKAGSMYEVVEGREPEAFRANDGRVWMIPGSDGRVEPAKGAADVANSANSGPMKINVTNPPGVPLRVANAYVERGELHMALEEAAALTEARIADNVLRDRGALGRAMKTKFRIKSGSVR